MALNSLKPMMTKGIPKKYRTNSTKLEVVVAVMGVDLEVTKVGLVIGMEVPP